MGKGLKGDFLGFSFNNYHSSDLGITRVSDGSRYNDNLLPTSQDKTAVISGGDGTYYWDTNFTQKPINISIVFDDLSEDQYNNLKKVFNVKKMGKLIYDETPYKYYMVKPTGALQLKALCFDKEGERVYKGEGTLQFVAYYPFAKSVYKWLNSYDKENYENKKEWSSASGMKEDSNGYDSYVNNEIKLFNPGDLEAEFYLYFTFSSERIIGNINIKMDNKDVLCLKTILKENEDDVKIRINSKTNLIEGIGSNGNLSGTLYNKYIESGDFFKIPLGESTIELANMNDYNPEIEYDYIYY